MNPSTKKSAPSRPSKSFMALAALVLTGQLVACAPRQTGVDQVPDINVAVTELKDAAVPGLPANVDLIVNDFLALPGGPPGCAVGVMENNQISGLEGYGLADISEMRPFTPATPSGVGSISKTLTALAVLRLEELNYLDIDDVVSQYLNGLPPAWQGFTLRQLLSHTTGLAWNPTFHPMINTTLELNQYYGLNPLNPNLGMHPRLVYPAILGTPIIGFPVGLSAQYSNAGYMLLGAVVDTVVNANAAQIGTDYASYESFTWRQAGLFDGTLSNGDQMITPSLYEGWRLNDIPELAMGYTWNGMAHNEIGAWNDPTLLAGPAGWEGPAGAWTMTIGDLTRLMMAIQNNDIISSTTRDTEMLVQHGQADVGKLGLGVFLDQKLGKPAYSHGGAHSGYRAHYTVWPNDDFGVAVLCNSIQADAGALANDIAETYIGSGTGGIGWGDKGGAPGIGAVQGDGSEPMMAQAEAQRLLIGLDTLESAQLAAETADKDKLIRLGELGCLDLAADVADGEGFDIATGFLACWDSSSSPTAFTACALDQADELIAKGILDRTQRSQIESCIETLAD